MPSNLHVSLALPDTLYSYSGQRYTADDMLGTCSLLLMPLLWPLCLEHATQPLDAGGCKDCCFLVCCMPLCSEQMETREYLSFPVSFILLRSAGKQSVLDC